MSDTDNEPEQPAVPEAKPLPPMPHGWVYLFHPSGAKLSLPLTEERRDYRAISDNVAAMLAAGLTVDPPSAPGKAPSVKVAQGEFLETVAFVLKKEVDSALSSSGFAPRVFLYSTAGNMKRPFLAVYLDTDEQQAEFEQVSGMKLRDMKKWVGKEAPELQDRDGKDFIYRLPRFIQCVWHQNPDWNAETKAATIAAGKVYGIPQKRFLRWATTQPVAAPEPKKTPAEAKDFETLRQNLLDLCVAGVPIGEFNAWYAKHLRDMAKGADRDRLGMIVKEHVGDRKWTFAPELREFVAVIPKEDPF